MHLISDDEDPGRIIARLLEALPAGSYLVVNAPASDVHADAAAEGARRLAESGSTPTTRRSREEVAGFFAHLNLVEPGMVQTHRWHPDPGISTGEYRSVSLGRGRPQELARRGCPGRYPERLADV